MGGEFTGMTHTCYVRNATRALIGLIARISANWNMHDSVFALFVKKWPFLHLTEFMLLTACRDKAKLNLQCFDGVWS